MGIIWIIICKWSNWSWLSKIRQKTHLVYRILLTTMKIKQNLWGIYEVTQFHLKTLIKIEVSSTSTFFLQILWLSSSVCVSVELIFLSRFSSLSYKIYTSLFIYIYIYYTVILFFYTHFVIYIYIYIYIYMPYSYRFNYNTLYMIAMNIWKQNIFLLLSVVLYWY